MKFHSRWSIAALFVVALIVSSVAKAAVINVSDGRIISIDGSAGSFWVGGGSNNYSHSVVPPTPFAPFDEVLSDQVVYSDLFGSAQTAGDASQTSSISSSLYSASGRASMSFIFSDLGDNTGQSMSKFDIQFSIDSPYVYTFTGRIDNSSTGIPAIAQAALRTGTGTNIEYFVGNDIFNVTGVLEAGTYDLLGSAAVDDLLPSSTHISSGVASFNFALNIEPVPLPAAVWLFGSGLLGLVAVARRRRSRPDIYHPLSRGVS
jgi:hypothetical protein